MLTWLQTNSNGADTLTEDLANKRVLGVREHAFCPYCDNAQLRSRARWLGAADLVCLDCSYRAPRSSRLDLALLLLSLALLAASLSLSLEFEELLGAARRSALKEAAMITSGLALLIATFTRLRRAFKSEPRYKNACGSCGRHFQLSPAWSNSEFCSLDCVKRESGEFSLDRARLGPNQVDAAARRRGALTSSDEDDEDELTAGEIEEVEEGEDGEDGEDDIEDVEEVEDDEDPRQEIVQGLSIDPRLKPIRSVTVLPQQPAGEALPSPQPPHAEHPDKAPTTRDDEELGAPTPEHGSPMSADEMVAEMVLFDDSAAQPAELWDASAMLEELPSFTDGDAPIEPDEGDLDAVGEVAEAMSLIAEEKEPPPNPPEQSGRWDIEDILSQDEGLDDVQRSQRRPRLKEEPSPQGEADETDP